VTTWVAVLVASLVAYATKLAGWLVPPRWLEHPVVLRATALLPPALLAALVVVQAASSGRHLVLDARAAGLAVAAVALLARAPFVAVVVLAAVAAAAVRAFGVG
jgi:hypothetical protein